MLLCLVVKVADADLQFLLNRPHFGFILLLGTGQPSDVFLRKRASTTATLETST